MLDADLHRLPESAIAQTERIVQLLKETLGERLAGVYLHGSLAMGSFRPGRSDIDALAVCSGNVPDSDKLALANGLLRLSLAPHPVELHVCDASQLHPWRHPCPFAFHYSEAWRGRYEDALTEGGGQSEDAAAPQGRDADGEAPPPALRTLAAFAGGADADLAAHLRAARERGIALAGPPPAEALPAVPDADYLDAIAADVAVPFRDVSKQPVYYVLNWLRVLRFAERGVVSSKEEAGVWGMTALPLHIEVVADALKLYRRPEPREALHFDVEPLQAFLRACRARLAAAGRR